VRPDHPLSTEACILDANTIGGIAAMASIDWGCAVQVMAAAAIGSNGIFAPTNAQTLHVSPILPSSF
jgi:hypothetical protein